MPKIYGVEVQALQCNRCPSPALDFKKLMEVWSGKVTYYFNLRMFEALVFAQARHDKLETRTVRRVFISYLNGVNCYKLDVEESRCLIRVKL